MREMMFGQLIEEVRHECDLQEYAAGARAVSGAAKAAGRGLKKVGGYMAKGAKKAAPTVGKVVGGAVGAAAKGAGAVVKGAASTAADATSAAVGGIAPGAKKGGQIGKTLAASRQLSHTASEIRLVFEADIWVTDPKTGKKVKYSGPVTKKAKPHSKADRERLWKAREKEKMRKPRGPSKRAISLRGGNFGGGGEVRRQPQKKSY